ncbi:U3 small nucleolar RNA-associated protein 25 [Microdochium nivale]|nr:U3 small nucleolar RNA-associated protein 25 [Microdochium nivale]
MRGRGNRGGPRGGSRGARGSRGQGRGGRGRGGATARSYGPKFDSQRVAELEESDDEVSARDQSLSEASSSEGEESDVEDEPQALAKPYQALMQSLAQEKESAPRLKRRKLEHQPTAETAMDVDSGDDSEAGVRDLDLVEEPEEGPEADIELDEDENENDSDNEDLTDPFETHIVNPDQAEVGQRIRAIKSKGYATSQAELNGWRVTSSTPGAKSKPPQPQTMTGPSSLKLKKKLVDTAAKIRPNFDKLEQVLYPTTFGYQDLLFCGRTPRNAQSLRRMYCLHAVNHVFKIRDRVIKNNAKLAKEGEETTFEPRDQGFTRPKILILLPTRQSAVHVVNTICSLTEPDQQEHRKRFDDSYLDKESKFGAERPEDFRDLFEGNDDDMFRLGVKFTRKTIKYFAQFYNSDILLASPLGLRMAIGSEDNHDKKSKQKGVDSDFLSSIEMVIVDQADALLMQNWEHIEYIFSYLNLQPREAHGCEFNRVREWYLNSQAANYRQTMIFSAFNTPELAELQRSCGNWAGRVRVQAEQAGAIQELGTKVRQTFSRFDGASIADEPDARFEYFTSAVVPALVRRQRDMSGTLIFVPSYLDFVRVRNYFATSAAVSSLTFGVISEYADVPEASRARSHFVNGRHKVLLYSERAHHFRRYALAGVQRVIMYGLPDNPVFYREIVGGYLAKSEQDSRIEPGTGSVRVLFSRYDVLKLERVVGSKRVGKMIREKGDTFDFV